MKRDVIGQITSRGHLQRRAPAIDSYKENYQALCFSQGAENLKKDCKKEEMLKKNILEIKLEIDLTNKKMLLRSTSRERNQDSTPKNVSTNIQHKQTQLLVVWVN